MNVAMRRIAITIEERAGPGVADLLERALA
jgi:hypothetical protein